MRATTPSSEFDSQSASVREIPALAGLLDDARLRVLRVSVVICLLITLSTLLGSLFAFTPSGDVHGPAVALSALWCALWALAAAFPRLTTRCFMRWRETAAVLALSNALTVASTGGIDSPVLAACMYVGWIASVVVGARAAMTMSLAIAGSVFAGYLLAGNTVAEIFTGPYRYAAVTNAVLPVLAGLVGTLLASVTNAILSHLTQSLQDLRRGAAAATSGLTALFAAQPIPALPAGQAQGGRERSPGAPLTNAEREVVALLAAGHRAKQIAVLRGVKLSTIRSQIKTAKKKTGARTLDQLVVLAWDADG